MTAWHPEHESVDRAVDVKFWWQTKQVAFGSEANSACVKRKLSVCVTGFTLRVWLAGVNIPCTLEA